MSLEKFLEFLQQIITMTNPEDVSSRTHARIALESLYALTRKSGMATPVTIRAMRDAVFRFDFLMAHRKEYAGKQGAYLENKAKRQRLEMLLVPHC